MLAIPLGKIINASPNTTTWITLPGWAAALLPPNGAVKSITFCAAQADTGVVTVMCKAPDGSDTATPIAELSRSSLYPFEIPEADALGVNPLRLGVKPAVANEGAYVTLWLD